MRSITIIFVTLILFSTGFGNALDCTKDIKLLIKNKNVEFVNSCVDHLKKSDNQYDLYFYYKTLLGLGKVKESELIFNKLEKIEDIRYRKIIQYEQLKKSINKKDFTSIAEQIRKHPNLTNINGVKGQIKNTVLGTEITQYTDLEALKFIVESLFVNKESSELIKHILNLKPPKISTLESTLGKLWITIDIKKISPKKRRQLYRLIRTSQTTIPNWEKHLTKQLRYRNFDYILRIIHLSQRGELKTGLPQQILQKFYIESKVKKRHFSSLLAEIGHKDSWLKFLPAERSLLEFSLLVKKGNIKEALMQMKTLEKDLYNVKPEKMFLQVAEFYYNGRKYNKSAYYYSKYLDLEVLPAKTEKGQWKRFMSFVRENDKEGISRTFEWADKHQFIDPENGAKFCYWKKKLGFTNNLEFEGCDKRFPNTFYGLKSLFKKSPEKGIKPILKERISPMKENLSPFSDDWVYGNEVLYGAGENDLADYMILEQRRNEPDPHYVFRMSETLLRNHRYNSFLRLLNSYDFEDLVKIESSEGKVRSFYFPLAFQNEVKLHSMKYNVPELLVYSVMREESRFHPEVESPAGATGLLQLMPATAKFIGKIIKRKVTTENLIDPELNLQLGVAYLNRLLRRYKGSYYYTLAAYNGGPTNVKKWKNRTKVDDEDYFLENIGFAETQGYVKKVLRSYFKYQLIYGKSL
ncbi:MAG: lytic transglycosylase domain-containing protein [Proteobacteria bacterium]|nr:lytic transglycosylase domain-containing protein [Pseudomonadota bacterium]